MRDGLFIERRMCGYSAQNIVKHNLFAHLELSNSSFEDNQMHYLMIFTIGILKFSRGGVNDLVF